MDGDQREVLTELVIAAAGPMLHANELMFRFTTDDFDGSDHFIVYSERRDDEVRVDIDITNWFDGLWQFKPQKQDIADAADALEGLIDYTTVVCLHPLGAAAIGEEDADAEEAAETTDGHA